MWAMAVLGRALTEAVAQRAIRDFKVRFTRPLRLGDVLVCTVEAGPASETAGRATLLLRCHVGDEPCLTGEAIVDLDKI
jgi:hypothetical protein